MDPCSLPCQQTTAEEERNLEEELQSQKSRLVCVLRVARGLPRGPGEEPRWFAIGSALDEMFGDQAMYLSALGAIIVILWLGAVRAFRMVVLFNVAEQMNRNDPISGLEAFMGRAIIPKSEREPIIVLPDGE